MILLKFRLKKFFYSDLNNSFISGFPSDLLKYLNRLDMQKNTPYFTAILLSFTLLVCMQFSFAQTTRTYNTSGTFTVPAGVTSIKVEVWGAGGGGGAATGNPSAGGGGAGGAYVRNNALTVTPGATYTVTVGSGGTGPTGSNATSGGASWFGSQSTLLAVGGTGGNRSTTNSNSAAGAVAPSTGNIGPVSYYGGNGGTGGSAGASGGGGGASAGTGSNGNSAIGMNGGIAVTGGSAGVSGTTAGANGANNPNYGGGGAGAKTNSTTDRTGGTGGNGAIVITWNCPTYSISGTESEGSVCINTPALIKLSANPGDLPVGNYTITYNLGGANISNGHTAVMNVSTAGTGTFNTINLTNSGNTTIMVTTLQSGTGTPVCNSTITANGTTNIVVKPAAAQPAAITGPTTFCAGSTYTYTVPNVAGSTYNWTFPTGWNIISGSNSNEVTVTTGTTAGNIVVSAQNECGSSINRILAVTRITPTITSTTPATRTDFGPLVLSATASAGATVVWYATAFGGNPLGTGNSYTTPDLVSTTTFYVEAASGDCYSSPRVAVAATISAPEISVSGNGFNIVDEDTTPETTDFTDLGITNVSIPLTRTYTIQNIGSVNLTIGEFTISGPHAGDFVVWTYPAATVVPGGSTTFSIRFTPSAVGIRNAELSFITNDADENPFNFAIRGTGGTGVSPEIQVRGGSTPTEIIDGDSGPTTADWTDFGTATIPGNVTRTFTIVNQGTGPLLLTGSPLVLVTGSPDFTLLTAPASTIAPGASTTFQIRYQPTTTGTAIALVTIYNNDSDESVYDFVIQGAAIVTGREIDIQGNEVSIASGDLTPSVLDQTDFGVTDTSTPISIPFNVYSFGSTSLTFSPTTVGISGTNASNFTATALPGSLASGGVTSFVVTFTPTTTGTKTATITVYSNDPDEGVYTFAVSATVQNPTPLTIAPGGVTSALKFWLKADSNISAVADNVAITNWSDQTTGSTKSALAKFAKEPKFKNNAADNVNFNPTVYFNGSNTMSGLQGFYNQEMFIVVRPTATITSATNAQDIYCGDDVTVNKNSQDVTGFQMGNTSSRHNNEILAYNQAANTAYGIAEISTTKSYSGVNIFNPRKSTTGRMEILCNGSKLATSEVATSTYKDINNSRYWLGRSEFFDASFEGDILEIINYGTKNSDFDRNKIETYLAIKYGITLGINGVSQNYIDSSGNIIYVSGTGFNYNIAGIGRDDQSNLNQKQSKTEVTSNDITIGLESIYETNSANPNVFEGDKSFLVWGSNNGTLGAQLPVLVDMSAEIPGLSTEVTFTSIGRTWKVEETGGDIPTVKISIPSTMLTSTITPPGDFLMFISDSPIFSPTAEYRIMKFNGSNLETTYDFDGTTYITFGYAPERTYERSIYFDGVNDYLDAGNVLNLDNKFTVSAWVKRNSTNRTILSKRNAAFTTGYDLHINAAGRAQMTWINGGNQTITSSVEIPAGKWHNIAVTYDGQYARLYIDGVIDTNSTVALLPVPSNTESFLVAGADGRTPGSFFNGNIDEVRVWAIALSESEIRYVMNQELLKHSDFSVTGSVIPQDITLNEVSDIPWNRLSVYYPMSTYTYTNAKDESDNRYTAAVKNLTTVDHQTAPLPYKTISNGAWSDPAVWANSNVQDLPYSPSIIDAALPSNSQRRVTGNIAQTRHLITSNSNKVLLALDVQNGRIDVSDSKMEVSHYLRLNGMIDLKDTSQLVQTLNSDLDPTSSGKIERDQQGQVNKFNYNYWSSPVGGVNTISNNNNYTISSVLKDGTNPEDIKDINWTSSYDASGGSPLTVSSSWIFKFQNIAPEYANWTFIGSEGNLRPGEGFTMKGSGAEGPTQNYTFTGKPNNGLITLAVGAGFLNLCGNPYPSALDGHAFIDANIGSINGALYFWEHFETNQTHNLADYQGGYATLTKVGGTPPVAPPQISGLGSSNRIPKRFIPVGQGFFVTGNATGGSIIFNNNQRAFVRENNTLSNVMFRPNQVPQTFASPIGSPDSNDDDTIEDTGFMKLRLGFNCVNNYHRQILMGFMNQFATSGLDLGYDAELFDDFPNDIYFLNGPSKLVIQGEGYFNPTAVYPLGVKTSESGNIEIMLDDIVNFGNSDEVYIYDAETQIYHDITNGSTFTVNLDAGIWNERFSLRFQNNTLNTETVENSKELIIAYSPGTGLLSIRYESEQEYLVSASIFNMLGQSINTHAFKNIEQVQHVPVGNLSAGTYIVKIESSAGTTSRKFSVK
jgi:hypothetical protein